MDKKTRGKADGEGKLTRGTRFTPYRLATFMPHSAVGTPACERMLAMSAADSRLGSLIAVSLFEIRGTSGDILQHQ